MKLFILSWILLPVMCFAQTDYCKKIIKSADQSGVPFCTCPDLNHLSVVKQFGADPYFVLRLHCSYWQFMAECKEATIIFEDGATATDKHTRLHCSQEKTIATRSNTHVPSPHAGEYIIEGLFHLTNDNIDKFATKKIVKIRAGTATIDINNIEATEVMHYIQCMKNLKLKNNSK